MVTIPSLFLSIFCKRESGGKKRRERKERQNSLSSLLGPCFSPLHLAPSRVPSPKHLEKALHMFPRRLLPEHRVCVFAHHVIDGLHDVQHFLWDQEREAVPQPSDEGPWSSLAPIAGSAHMGHVCPVGSFIYTQPLPFSSCPHLLGDAAILVEVIQVKGPVQPVVCGSPKNHRQTSHKILGTRQGELCLQTKTQSPQERRRPGPPPAHLKTDRAIMVSVKGIEEKSGVSAGVCGTKAGRQERPSSPIPGASHTLPNPSPHVHG